MNRIASYIFYPLWILYAIYNVLWLVGFTFSYGTNDTASELIFPAVTFIADIPIFWIANKKLRLAVSLLAITLTCSLVLAFSFHIWSSFAFAYWYVPKLILFAALAFSNLTRLKESSIRQT